MEYYLIGIFLIVIGGILMFLYLKEIINNDKIIVSAEIKVNRLKICNNCEYIKLKHSIYKRCSKCGCFLNAKSKLLNQDCPIGKWD